MTMAGGSAAREGAASAHADRFVREQLPPRELWPVLDFSTAPGLRYPPRLNCAAELLDRWVERGDGERTVIHWPGGRWSYRELMETANRIANVLVEDLGLATGGRVLLCGPNHPMLAACWFAVLKAGGVCVTTMPLLRARELAHVMEKARVGIALCDARVTAESERAGASAGLGRLVCYNDHGPGTLEDMMRRRPATFRNVDTAADDPALVAFTSGTTGKAKGTVHFHRDVLTICDCFPCHVLRATRDDVFCGSPPLGFTFGLGGILLFPMRIGASTLLLEQAQPPRLLEGMQEFGTSVCFTAPTAYRTMAGMAGEYDLSRLRLCVSAGEHLPAATFERWRDATGLSIIDGIGSTEMLHIFISASGSDIRPGSTGKVVPGYRARVVDEEGRELPPGTIGHLAVQGATGCRYLADPERQAGYVRGGWNYPGDSYCMDDEGYFWYQARTDDLIVSSGYKISGPEVENALLDHRAVLECGVVGVPDVERGQIVKAFIVLRDGRRPDPALTKELQEFVKGQIAPYKYPRAIEFVDALPRTETGKLQRYRLREGA
ncbi:MAG TPA: AMP-binding protein [Gemmatimonadaceae bacterium]|nr:AMP-binding protein [Gemmatimonadaceae bacterium]